MKIKELNITDKEKRLIKMRKRKEYYKKNREERTNINILRGGRLKGKEDIKVSPISASATDEESKESGAHSPPLDTLNEIYENHFELCSKLNELMTDIPNKVRDEIWDLVYNYFDP